MEQEIWKSITNYEQYQISNNMIIKSYKKSKQRIMKPIKQAQWLPCIRLYNKNWSRKFKIYKLYSLMFEDNKYNIDVK